MDSSIIKVVTIDEAIGLTTSNLSRRAHILNRFIKKPFRLKLPKAIEIYFEPLDKFSFIQILRICCCTLGLLNLTFAFRGIKSFRFSSILEMLEVSKPIKDMHAVLFRDFQEQPFKILEFSMLQIPLAYR